MEALEQPAKPMEQFNYIPPQEIRKPTPEMPELSSETEVSHDLRSDTPEITKKSPENHQGVVIDYNQLSEASQNLYGKFMLYMTESKRSDGGALQDALLRFSIEHTIPNDLRQFLSKTYTEEIPKPIGGESLFTKKLDKNIAALRTRQLVTSEHFDPPPPAPSRWKKLWNKAIKPFSQK